MKYGEKIMQDQLHNFKPCGFHNPTQRLINLAPMDEKNYTETSILAPVSNSLRTDILFNINSVVD